MARDDLQMHAVSDIICHVSSDDCVGLSLEGRRRVCDRFPIKPITSPSMTEGMLICIGDSTHTLPWAGFNPVLQWEMPYSTGWALHHWQLR